jgi:addiction module HigA family antidote
MKLSANALADVLKVPANRISLIVAEERSITADTALRLARALGTSPEFWLNLQMTYELRLAEQDKDTVKAVRHIKRLTAA